MTGAFDAVCLSSGTWAGWPADFFFPGSSPPHLALLLPLLLYAEPQLCPWVAQGLHADCADKGGDWSEGQVVTGVRYKAADGEEVVVKAHLTVGNSE